MIDNNFTVEERTGIICIIQIRRDCIEVKQQQGLLAYVQSQNKAGDKLPKPLKDKDVNIMFGWAIFNLRLNKKKDQDNNMVEYTSGYFKCQNDIEFLGGMSMYADEAFESPEYLSKFYD